MDPDTKTLLEHYKHLEPITAGRVGWLDSEQTAKLRQLWGLLLREFATSEDVPVLFSLSGPQAAAADATQIAATADSNSDNNDLASLSFEPLMPISTKDTPKPSSRQSQSQSQSQSQTPTPKKQQQSSSSSSSSSGWLSWAIGSTTPSTPTTSGTSTPTLGNSNLTTAEKDHEDEATKQRRTETVQQRMAREGLENAVSAEFVPLFGEQLLKRRFRTGFWQAATQIGNPDSWVLRFLRARNWDVDKALDMIRRTVVWRIGQAIDEISFYGESCLHHHTMESGLA
ncbi:phosphatidylinositol transfer protein csr1, partial [Coemansia erecta]